MGLIINPKVVFMAVEKYANVRSVCNDLGVTLS